MDSIAMLAVPTFLTNHLKRAIPRYKHHLSMASISRCPRKKLKHKIFLTYSDVTLASCAQLCVLQMPY